MSFGVTSGNAYDFEGLYPPKSPCVLHRSAEHPHAFLAFSPLGRSHRRDTGFPVSPLTRFATHCANRAKARESQAETGASEFHRTVSLIKADCP